MTISVYQKGDMARITGEFTNPSDEAIDPTGVSLLVTDPSGVTTEYVYQESPTVITREELGSFYADISVDESGRWFYRWESTGTGQAGQNGEFHVEPSAFVVEEEE